MCAGNLIAALDYILVFRIDCIVPDYNMLQPLAAVAASAFCSFRILLSGNARDSCCFDAY